MIINKQLFIKRIVILALGLFILAFGIALSTKSGLGVSPSAGLAYVLSQIFPLSMGLFTTFVNVIFVILQIALLRKNYKIINLLQLVVVFLFSYFTDLTLAIVSPLEISSYPIRLILCIVSCLIMAFGVFLEVKAGLIVMASEGAISAISDKIHLDFGTIKIILDWVFIGLSTLISILYFKSLIGVREGTIIAAFLVGYFVRFYNKKIHFIDKFLAVPAKEDSVGKTDDLQAEYPLVITIEREFGSGGHEIGEKVAKALNIPFYDYGIIAETAANTGLPVDSIKNNEERVKTGLVFSLVQNSYEMSQMTSKQDEIFAAQSKVIKDLASKGSCVIVGRLGGYVLKDRPNTFDLFFSADDDFKAKRVSNINNISFEEAKRLVKHETELRVHYCQHFTGMPWGLAAHYNLTMHTSDFGIEESVNTVLDSIKAYEKNKVFQNL